MFCLFQHPPAEGDDVAHGVDDGKDEPPRLRVGQPLVLFRLDDRAAVQNIVAAVTLVQEVLRQALEIERGAQTELSHGGGSELPVQNVLHMCVCAAGIEVVEVKMRAVAQDF